MTDMQSNSMRPFDQELAAALLQIKSKGLHASPAKYSVAKSLDRPTNPFQNSYSVTDQRMQRYETKVQACKDSRNSNDSESVRAVISPPTQIKDDSDFLDLAVRETRSFDREFKTDSNREDLSLSRSSSVCSLSDGTTGHLRREKIVAALQSQPQRGRKRDNLNEIERMELTRTRNREHAKSTRIRKKARYEELLKKEIQLKEYQESEDLNMSRRQNVVDFMYIRSKMLPGASHWECGTVIDVNDLTKTPPYAELQTNLNRMIKDSSDFTFQWCCEDQGNMSNLPSFQLMKLFDESFSHRVSKCFGASSLRGLSLNLRHSSIDSIALSPNGTALVSYEITLKYATRVIQLASVWHRFQFAQNSSLLEGVEITLVNDSFDGHEDEYFKAQVSHPSVISLDPPSRPSSCFLRREEQELDGGDDTEPQRSSCNIIDDGAVGLSIQDLNEESKKEMLLEF